MLDTLGPEEEQLVGNHSDESERASEILEMQRGVSNRLGSPPQRPSMLGSFASRFFLERARRLREEADRELLSQLAEQRLRSLVEIQRPPIPIAQMAVVGRFFGQVAEISRDLQPLLSPGGDIIIGVIEDLHTALTGYKFVYSELEDVEVPPLERVLAGVNSALTIIPEASVLLRAGTREIVQFSRNIRRSLAEVETTLAVLDRFAGRRQAIQDVMATIRAGRRLTAQQRQILHEFAEELSRIESRLARRVPTGETRKAFHPSESLVETRGTANRATHPSSRTPRELETGTSSRSARGRQRRPRIRGRRQRGRRLRRPIIPSGGRFQLSSTQEQLLGSVLGKPFGAASQSPRAQKILQLLKHHWDDAWKTSRGNQHRTFERALSLPRGRRESTLRSIFNNHRRRWVTSIYNDAELQRLFREAGIQQARGGMPYLIYEAPDGTIRNIRLNVDHSERLVDRPDLALSSENLRLITARENSVVLEELRRNERFWRNADPEARQMIEHRLSELTSADFDELLRRLEDVGWE
jgi:hypothetical protein